MSLRAVVGGLIRVSVVPFMFMVASVRLPCVPVGIASAVWVFGAAMGEPYTMRAERVNTMCNIGCTPGVCHQASPPMRWGMADRDRQRRTAPARLLPAPGRARIRASSLSERERL